MSLEVAPDSRFILGALAQEELDQIRIALKQESAKPGKLIGLRRQSRLVLARAEAEEEIGRHCIDNHAAIRSRKTTAPIEEKKRRERDREEAKGKGERGPNGGAPRRDRPATVGVRHGGWEAATS